MAVLVVDFLEIIHVDHQHRQRITVTARAAQFDLAQFIEMPPVVQPGQAVGDGHFLELFEQPRVLDGDRNLAGKS